MASPLNSAVTGCSGRVITAVDVTTSAADQAQLLPMLEQAHDNTSHLAAVTLADAGYHSGANVAACVERGQPVMMPEASQRALAQPYHKMLFSYDAERDTYTCPLGQTLTHLGQRRRPGRLTVQVYRGSAATCGVCPAFGLCTTNRRGRVLEVGPHEDVLHRQRKWMDTAEVKATYRQRKSLIEPVFGILKEQQAGRRLLLRGFDNVRAEITLLATAFNLRTLCRVWQVASAPLSSGPLAA